MADDGVYRRLQQHLDHLPQRYPATASGVELRILERLFTPEEARLALELSAFPEPAATIRRRLQKKPPLNDLVASLDALAARGLITRIEPRGVVKYLLAPFVVGIYEHHLPRLTAEFERELLQYYDEGFGAAVASKKTTLMRTVPIDVNLAPDRQVGTYDDIRAYVRDHAGPFALMDCICRLGRSLVGHTCEHTTHMQTCLTFGHAAEGMVQSGAGHFISRDEVLQVLAQADHDALVVQPENTQRPLFVCCCCGDCCGVLTNAKRFPEPAEYFSTTYFATADADTCEGCGTCLTRCRMDAVSLDTGRAVVARTHCIGCGLCVGTCPSGSITLTKKDHARVPPKNTPALYAQLYRDRYGTLGLAKAAGKHLLGMKV
jgi:ferredoxin